MHQESFRLSFRETKTSLVLSFLERREIAIATTSQPTTSNRNKDKTNLKMKKMKKTECECELSDDQEDHISFGKLKNSKKP